MTPTIGPTTGPTTLAPTTGPTTLAPTTEPTTGPTTSTPTTGPTVSSPTKAPSKTPSGSYPTAAPTTSNPTATPSAAPSSNPTVDPTTTPSSSDPTTAPTTLAPTTTPTRAPTQAPLHGNPTMYPTTAPTAGPTPAAPVTSASVPTSSPWTIAPTTQPINGPFSPSPTEEPSSAAPASSSPTTSPTRGISQSQPTPKQITGISTTTTTAAIEIDLIALGSTPGKSEQTTPTWWVILLILLLVAILATVSISWTRSRRTKITDPEIGTAVEPVYCGITHRGGLERINPAYTGGARPAGDHGAALRNALYAEMSNRPAGALANGLYGDMHPPQVGERYAWGSNDLIVPHGQTTRVCRDDPTYSDALAPSPDSHYTDIMPQPEGIYDTPFKLASAGESLYDTPTNFGGGGGVTCVSLGRDEPIYGSMAAAGKSCPETGLNVVLPGSMHTNAGSNTAPSTAFAEDGGTICPIPMVARRIIRRRRGSTLPGLRQEAAANSSGRYRDVMPIPGDAVVELNSTPTPEYIDVNGSAEDRHEHVLYDFAGSQAGELSVKSGEVVRIITPDAAGWTEVSTASGSTGFVPTSYI